ncbi:DUF6020 family protein [Butyrivibrio sp. MC2021]|uniref:DUF6020 family protein n=1 Tax=Butyrivibrio sp. MC2021 TaxID=1408306 RepID=UPI00047A5E8C|nr:DUF6020 family protein [Butyrivibrio sp. MC2021]
MKAKIEGAVEGVCAVLFALAFSLTKVYNPDNAQKFSWLTLVIGFILFIGIIRIADFFSSCWREEKTLKISSKTFFVLNFIAIFLIGILFQVIYYPATCNNDTIFMIRGGLGTSGQHPWEYIIMARAFRKIAWALGETDNEALILFCVFQIIIISLACAYCLTWLKEKGVPKTPLIIIDAFFLLCPILNLYKITLVKDVIFTVGLMLMVPVMYDLWETEGESIKSIKEIALLLISTYLMMCRNNGFMICAVIAVYCCVAYRKVFKYMLLYAVVIALFFASTRFIQHHANAQYRFREAVGVPIQQIAATVSKDGNITDIQRAFLEKIMPIEAMKEQYDPYNADRIKYGEARIDDDFLNAHRAEFLKTYFEMMFSNFDIYVDSYLRCTYGFWSFSNKDYKMRYTYIGAFAAEDSFASWFEEQKIYPRSLAPQGIQSLFENGINTYSVFLGVGTTAWCVLCIILLLHRKNKIGCGVSLPFLLCWVTILMATPIAFQWRYGLCFAVALPVYYGILNIPSK